jgi:integrase
MRQDEICRIEWCDFDPRIKLLIIRDRKDPRKKSGNNQRIPLLDVTGYDACEQCARMPSAGGRIFPYNARSVGTAFGRRCRQAERP